MCVDVPELRHTCSMYSRRLLHTKTFGPAVFGVTNPLRASSPLTTKDILNPPASGKWRATDEVSYVDPSLEPAKTCQMDYKELLCDYSHGMLCCMHDQNHDKHDGDDDCIPNDNNSVGGPL